MGYNKNFVVKNGLEVGTNLIVADPTTLSVGIGTTVPQYTLHTLGGRRTIKHNKLAQHVV